jgi:hypothetical protein
MVGLWSSKMWGSKTDTPKYSTSTVWLYLFPNNLHEYMMIINVWIPQLTSFSVDDIVILYVFMVNF